MQNSRCFQLHLYLAGSGVQLYSCSFLNLVGPLRALSATIECLLGDPAGGTHLELSQGTTVHFPLLSPPEHPSDG